MNAINCFLEPLTQLHLVDEETVAGALFVPLYDFAMQRWYSSISSLSRSSRSM